MSGICQRIQLPAENSAQHLTDGWPNVHVAAASAIFAAEAIARSPFV
jgi:hypothetical protein